MSKSNPTTVDEALDSARERISRECGSCCEDLENKIREAPLASVLIAAAGAYFLSFFPLGALLRAIIKVFLALIKPGLFLFGVVKLVEYLRHTQTSQLAGDEERDPVIDSPVGPPTA